MLDTGSCKSDTRYGCLGSVTVLKSRAASVPTSTDSLNSLVLEAEEGKAAFYCGDGQLDAIRPQTWHTAIR